MNAADILSLAEVRAVLDSLRKKKAYNCKLNLTIFRLSCCCGLRCKEMCGLTLGDFTFAGDRPAIRIRKGVTKGRTGHRRARIVPLWWDTGTREDLSLWWGLRAATGAGKDDPFLVKKNGGRLDRIRAAGHWKTAIKVLGIDRVSQLHIHCGRHSFCSHALTAGHSLVAVRDAAGHRNISTTNIYLHCAEELTPVPDIFGGNRYGKRDGSVVG